MNTKRILVAESGRRLDHPCIRAEAAAAEKRAGRTLARPSLEDAIRFREPIRRRGEIRQSKSGRSVGRRRDKRVRARRSNLIVAGVPPENGYPLSGITVQGGTFITGHRALARPNDRPFPAARSARSGEISQPEGFIFYDGGVSAAAGA